MEVGQRDSYSHTTMSQINITPFVDVMLVLLVIFMVTAPMMERGIDVDLPQVEEAPGLEQSAEPIRVYVDKKGAIFIGDDLVESTAKLSAVMKQVLKNKKIPHVLLEADSSITYGRIVEVIAALKMAGVEDLGMVAEEIER